jgi:7-cyano-7-deazaguanine synthase in queuosine biosynthesis
VIDNCQNAIHGALETHFAKPIRHIHIKVYGRKHAKYPFPTDENRENTQRTRSFLFLAIAALCARRCKFNRVVYMAENGQFAIHLPLTAARVGPFSTHTADPKFVKIMEGVLKILLNNPSFEITNPFVFLTKAEVFGVLPAPLKKAAEASASCWMISRTPGNKHCGYCIPCISRRIAIEYNDLYFKEYHVDIFKTDVTKLADTDDKKRNLVDYLEFILRFSGVTDGNRHLLFTQFPELYSMGSGVDQVIEMYKRVAHQSFEVLKRYPKVQKLFA